MDTTIKKVLSLFLTLVLVLGLAPAMTLSVNAAGGTVDLTKVIKDDNLRAVVFKKVQTIEPTAVITAVNEAVLDQITFLDANSEGIQSIEGIGCLKKLRQLQLGTNKIDDITELAGLTDLSVLVLESNQIRDISALSGLQSLTGLHLYGNQISDITALSGLSALEILGCAENRLTSLDVSGLSALKQLYCYSNRLTSLDVSGLSALWWLDCHDNRFPSLDVSGCGSLTYLDCSFNYLPSEDAIKGFNKSQYEDGYIFEPQSAPRAIVVSRDVRNAMLELDLYAAPTGTVKVLLDDDENNADYSNVLWAEVTQCDETGVAEVDVTGTLNDTATLTVTAKSVGETEFIVEYWQDYDPRTADFSEPFYGAYATSAVTVSVTDSTPRPGSQTNNRRRSSGGGNSNPAPAAQPSEYIIDQTEMRRLIASAEKNGWDFVRSSSNLPTIVKGNAWKLLGNRKFIARTTGSPVQVQLTFPEPNKLTADMRVSGHVKGSAVDSRKALFEKWYANKIRVIHLEHTGGFGQPVEIAAKVDLTGMDTDNLYFYSYDKATNSYKRIEAEYWIDKNGYVHFTTELGGDIIISEGALERK